MQYPYVEALANKPSPKYPMAGKIQTEKMPMQDENWTAKELHTAFCENWSEYNERCYGKRQTVTGVVMWMGKDIHNKHSIQLSNSKDGNCYVHCVIISEDYYGDVKVGDTITMQGNYLECHPEFGVVLKYSEVVK